MNLYQDIREISAQDLSALHRESLPDGWSPSSFAKLLEDSQIHGEALQAKSGTLIGFILWRVVDQEAEILTFVIHPQHQGKKNGKILLERLLNRLNNQGIQEIFLEVAVNNPKALSLYTQSGFILCGRRPQYYQTSSGEQIDAFILKKRFPIA